MKSVALQLLLVLHVLWPASASAHDLSRLYDASVLEQWRPRYQRSTLKILNEVILPVLTAEERRRLGNTPRLEFPLYAEGHLRGRPLAFYVPPGAPRVVFPVLSLRFLDEVCTAYAWLQINGYTLETISEYTAMLRYTDFRGGKAPPPLQALHIPDNALNDPRVAELSLGHFVTARTFLLLHELGHLYHAHHATTYEQSRHNEEEADRFAAEVMHRTPLPPLGALVFFFADAHWSGYPSSAEDTHPLSGARLRALARQVDDPEIASGLANIGELLDDPEIRVGFAATGKAGDIASLAPRRRGDMPRSGLAARPAPGIPGFHGRYVGRSTQVGTPQPFPIELIFERQGDSVKGKYSFGVGTGKIAGTAVEDTLYFDWEWAGNQGRGKLISRDGGNVFDGTWGYRDSADNAGTWAGQRPH